MHVRLQGTILLLFGPQTPLHPMALRCTKPFLRLRTCCLGTTHCKRSVASARTLPAVDASFGRSVQLPAQHDKGTDKHDRFTCHASLSSLLDGSDVVGDYTQQLTEEVGISRQLAKMSKAKHPTLNLCSAA